MTPAEAEAILGLRLRPARRCGSTRPTVRRRSSCSAWRWRRPSSGSGSTAFPAQDPATFAAATAAGPDVLGEVLETAIADGKTDLAAAAVTALGQVTDRDGPGRRRPAPSRWSRRCRRPAAGSSSPPREALVELAPDAAVRRVEPGRPDPRPVRRPTRPCPAPWSSTATPSRGSQLAGFLKELGYDADAGARPATEGFRAAAESADVELILIDHDLIQGDWRLTDTLANLRADARTAGLPIYVVGPLDLRVQAAEPASGTSRASSSWSSRPTPAMLERQLGGRPAGADRRRAGRLRPRGGRAPGPDRRAAAAARSRPTCAPSSRPWPSP